MHYFDGWKQPPSGIGITYRAQILKFLPITQNAGLDESHLRRKRKYRSIGCVWVDSSYIPLWFCMLTSRSFTCYMHFWRILNPINIKGIRIKLMEYELFWFVQSFQYLTFTTEFTTNWALLIKHFFLSSQDIHTFFGRDDQKKWCLGSSVLKVTLHTCSIFVLNAVRKLKSV